MKEPESFIANQFKNISLQGSTTKIQLELNNPARQAATIPDISGTLEIFVPNKDTNSRITVENFVGKKNVPISNSVLKSLGIEVVIKKPEESDGENPLSSRFGVSLINAVALEIKDPDSKLIKVEFQEENGKIISSNGYSTVMSGDLTTKIFYFEEKLPSKAQLNLYLFTSEQ